LADKSTPLILEALSRAAAEPAGLSLYAGRGARGLFASSAAARQAAQRCKAEGLLQLVRTETRGKSVTEVCAITEKGLAYLLAQTSPKQVIEDFLRALDARQEQLSSVLDSVRQVQSSLEAIRALAERLAPNATLPVGPLPSANGSGSWQSEIAGHLSRWHDTGANSDCPLADLYRHALKSAPHLTIGQFHDFLRKLHDEERIYLHPWTGPLCDLPEPSLALLIGHEIAYYASIRSSG
jgi:hypothetical protein